MERGLTFVGHQTSAMEESSQNCRCYYTTYYIGMSLYGNIFQIITPTVTSGLQGYRVTKAC